MTTRFTRLSIVAGGHQLDASLPAARPVAEYLYDLLRMLPASTDDAPPVWGLSSPARGAIDLDRSLDDAGVLDGEILYLSAVDEVAESPDVDDVLAVVARSGDVDLRAWEFPARDAAITWLLAMCAAALIASIVGVGPSWLSGVLLVVLAVALVAIAASLRERGGVVLGWLAVPAAALALLRLASAGDIGVRAAAAVAGASLAVAGVARVGHRHRGGVVAGIVLAVAAATTVGGLAAGARGTDLAAWASPAIVLLLGMLPQLGLSSSGVVSLVRQGEAGTAVARAEVARRVAAGRASVDGFAVALAVVGAVQVGVLIWAGQTGEAALGGLVALIFCLRSRGFSSARHVALLLAVPTVGALTAALALPRWVNVAGAQAQDATRIAAVLAVGLVVAGCGYGRLGEVLAARVSRAWDRIDMLAVLALVPVLLVAQHVLGWIADKL